MTDPRELLKVAAMLATEAGELIIEGRTEAKVTGTKSSDIDIVTQMDLASERHIRKRLSQLRPDDAVMGEEGEHSEGSSGVTWIVDPIDGTVNYLYGLPHFGVSIAAVSGGVDPLTWSIEAGAVYTGAGELFTAVRGGGALRNGVPLLRTETAPLAKTLLGTGFQYVATHRVAQARIVEHMIGRVRDIRRLGAASVDLCLAAAGELDAYYEHGLRAWDFAAGALIASEAGLRVAGIDGDAPDEHLVIAAMPQVWDQLRDALEEAGARRPFDELRA